jgi:hypothetical protein
MQMSSWKAQIGAAWFVVIALVGYVAGVTSMTSWMLLAAAALTVPVIWLRFGPPGAVDVRKHPRRAPLANAAALDPALTPQGLSHPHPCFQTLASLMDQSCQPHCAGAFGSPSTARET